MAGLPLPHPLRTISVLVVYLVLPHFCRGQSQLIGPPQPIVATVGDDIILPCHLEPAVNVAAKTLEWTRAGLNPRFVYVRRAGQDLVSVKNPSYTGRTALSIDELKHGNISLKLSKVKPTDEGRYKCYIPDMDVYSFVDLVVGAVSMPFISLARIDRDKGGVVLQCGSAGWYPEPEVLWLDAEGKLLSAGPPEAVRGPDGLYTVSSRVTVEERHSNSFACRVQQKDINQTRETHIHVQDDFFEVQSSYSPVIIGLAVSLAACILLLLLLGFFVKKRKVIIIRGKKNRSETNKTEDQFSTEGEIELLRTDGTREMEVLKKGKAANNQPEFTEQQCREDAENRVKILTEELETKKNEVETKQAELQQLHEEQRRNENDLQTLKEDLENKNKELERLRNSRGYLLWSSRKEEQQKEKEVETLKQQLETHQKKLETGIKKSEDQQAEVQQLQDEIQRMETNLQTLTASEYLQQYLLESSNAAPFQSSSSVFKWQIISKQKFQDEQVRRKEAQDKVQVLEEWLQTKDSELQDEQKRRKEAENEVQILQTKIREVEPKHTELQQLRDEKQRNENDLQTLMINLQTLKKDLENKKKQLEMSGGKVAETGQQLTTKSSECIYLQRELEETKEKLLALENTKRESQQQCDPYLVNRGSANGHSMANPAGSSFGYRDMSYQVSGQGHGSSHGSENRTGQPRTHEPFRGRRY